MPRSYRQRLDTSVIRNWQPPTNAARRLSKGSDIAAGSRLQRPPMWVWAAVMGAATVFAIVNWIA